MKVYIKKILSEFNKSFQVTSLTVVLILAVPFIPVIGKILSLPEGFFPEDFEFWKIKGSANMRL